MSGLDTISGSYWSAARSSLASLGTATARPWSGWAGGTGALLAGAVFLCLAALLVSVNVTQLRMSFGWERHADDVLLQVERERESLLQAESAARGYVLGGGGAALATYRAADADAARSIVMLGRLTADNPVQVARMKLLRPMVDTRLKRLAQAPATAPLQTGDPAAEKARGAKVQENERLMASIRGQLDAFRNTELALLAQRQAEADRRATRSIALAIVTALIATALGIAGVHLLMRERSAHHVREMRTELMHNQRLALMGQTASMLAHELNQPLAAATNYLSALRRLAAGGATLERVDETAQKAQAQIQRAGGIVKRLRSFIDKRDSERSLESPATLIEDAVMLLGTLDESIKLETIVAPAVPPVLIDRVQLQQVLVNLLRNALEAMRGSVRRELELRVRATDLDMVEISLRDTGPGLPKEVAARLFQPFVTSKKDGMGVGLSICQSIVTDHGGTIWAESAPGGGTLFHFTLPTASNEREAA
jgi:two-component system, LuxR family, sensor kinase FixL